MFKFTPRQARQGITTELDPTHAAGHTRKVFRMSIEQTQITRVEADSETRVRVTHSTDELDHVVYDRGVARRVYYAADGGIDEYRTFGRLID
jgi:hypothetical protein